MLNVSIYQTIVSDSIKSFCLYTQKNLSSLSFLLKIVEYINMNMTIKLLSKLRFLFFCLALLNTLDISCTSKSMQLLTGSTNSNFQIFYLSQRCNKYIKIFLENHLFFHWTELYSFFSNWKTSSNTYVKIFHWRM